MKKTLQPEVKEGFGIRDILYTLFKHKWKIIAFSLLGCIAAAWVFYHRETLYRSQAKLLVRYVLNRNVVDAFQSQLNMTGGPGDQIINTEIQILTSEDLALAVAKAVGPARIVPAAGEAATLSDAAGTILTYLEVGAVPGNVIHINYSNQDPALSVEVLRELVQQYAVKHLEIHRSAAAFDLVAKEAAEVGKRLSQTEAELDKLRTESGITTLAEATSALATQRARTQEDLMTAKAELAEQQARIKSLEQAAGIVAPAAKAKVNEEPETQVPPRILTEYKTMLDILDVLRKRDIELRIKFRPGNRLVELNQSQLSDYERKRVGLLGQYPDLATQAILPNENPEAQDLSVERARLASINARLGVFNKHLEEIREQFNIQYAIGAQIEGVERRKQMEDAEFRSLEQNLKNAKVDQTLDPSRMPNITIVQQPSHPIKTYDDATQKIVLGLAGGGMALGLGLAFLIEFLFDRRIKGPIDVTLRLQMPLLISIPYLRIKERGGSSLPHPVTPPKIGRSEDSDPKSINAIDKPIKAGSRIEDHFIMPYTETIRDRIIFNFEVNNITHKPKLVAVTALTEGAGASTIAAGIAKSFSEVEGAKVLLIDLSSCHPEDSPIFGEVARHSVQGALQLARHHKFKENPQSLYYASAIARRGTAGVTSFSPLNLYELLPHLQASDYDYIIFDMPPVDQTSRTLVMAGLMDKVLLVLDAENTSRDALRWGYSELIKGRADVSCVFNKVKSHAPSWLNGEP